MVFQFGQFKVDIDVEKTQEFYKSMNLVSKGCQCSGCRNYEIAIDILPNEVKNFFDTIGIDMKKVTEVYVNVANPDNSLYYEGFYHLCGSLLQGESEYSLTKDFYISFQEDCVLMEDGFPTPALQLEISANIPWALNEDNTYFKSSSFCLYERGIHDAI